MGEAAKGAHFAAVEATPVKTARLISNWRVDVGTKPSEGQHRGPFVFGNRSASAAGAKQQAIGVIATFNQPTLPLIVNNPTPYYKYVDRGAGGRPARNMSGAGAAAGEAALKRALRTKLRTF